MTDVLLPFPIEYAIPPDQWNANPDRLNQIGEGLLAVALDVLRQMNLDKDFEYAYVGHGTDAPIVYSDSGLRQLAVVCTKLHVGRAGEELFQFYKGEPAKAGQELAQFTIQVAAPYPRVSNTGHAIPLDAITEQRRSLWRCGTVIWAAMRALSLGAVSRPWPDGTGRIASAPTTDDMHVGPLTPKDPQGGQAAWYVAVAVAV